VNVGEKAGRLHNIYTNESLIRDLSAIGIMPDDTLLVHSSMKAIGEVEGGADTVLDAFAEHMEPGLLIFPTHTWNTIGSMSFAYHPLTEISCVGILSNLYRIRMISFGTAARSYGVPLI